MKKRIGIAFIAIFTVISSQILLAEEEIRGVSASTVKPDTDFNAYDILYVKKIDMSEVKLDGAELFYDYDDESGGRIESAGEIEDLEYKYRMMFGKALSEAITVTYRKTKQKEKRVMVLLLKIMGELKETRLLENLMPGEAKREAKVLIEGHLIDQETREELVSFLDESISMKSEEDESIFDEDDMEVWDLAVTLWAKGLAGFLAQRRGKLYVVSR